jgi:hypothetical protein
VLSLEREAGVRSRHQCLRWNRRHGLSGQSVLQPWRGYDGRPDPPSPLEAVKNSSVESSIMAHSGVIGLLRGEPIKVTHEPLSLGERLRSPKKSTMNSRLPKRTVSQREKPPHVKRSPLIETVSANE